VSYVKIGIIVNTHGIKGDVKVKNFTDDIDRFEELDYIFIEAEGKMKKLHIEGIRYAKSLAIIKFENYNDINDIEHFKGKDIYIEKLQLRELPQDTYHVFDLIGLDVNENGKHIGKLVDVNQNAYQDIYMVKTGDGEIIQIPAVKSFVKSIDLEKGIMEVELIEGMIQ